MSSRIYLTLRDGADCLFPDAIKLQRLQIRRAKWRSKYFGRSGAKEPAGLLDKNRSRSAGWQISQQNAEYAILVFWVRDKAVPELPHSADILLPPTEILTLADWRSGTAHASL